MINAISDKNGNVKKYISGDFNDNILEIKEVIKEIYKNASENQKNIMMLDSVWNGFLRPDKNEFDELKRFVDELLNGDLVKKEPELAEYLGKVKEIIDLLKSTENQERGIYNEDRESK